MKIANKSIGIESEPFIIAEMSGNHDNSLEKALAIVDAAAKAGVSALKLQTYTADTLTLDVNKKEFKIDDLNSLWHGESLYDLYSKAHTPWEWHETLFERGRQLGITVFSTPFDHTAVDFLEECGAPAYKIASFEIVDLPLIEKVCETGKPIIVSTGMADESEIEEAVSLAERLGCQDLALLHCVSAYPALPEESNLKTIKYLEDKFGKVVGLSDHTLGTTVSTVAVGLGARIIEKHVTLSRKDAGSDSAFSLEPSELQILTRDCRIAWECLGHEGPHQAQNEMKNQIFRKSIYAVKDIPEGARIAESDVKVIRPGYGLKPKFMGDVIGRRASRQILRGTALAWDMFETSEK